jgi:hypothetical protein
LPKPWKYPERNRFVEILQLGLPIFDFLKFLMGPVKITLGSPGLSRVTVFKCDSPWAEIQQVKQLKDSNAQMQATWHGLNIGMI